MPSVQTILNEGFSDGSPWDSNPWRRFALLWIAPVGALVIAVSGAFITQQRLAADNAIGYVVINDADCTLVVADRPGGPPVDTVEQNSGGRLGTCGGLDRDQQVFYDPGRGIQVLGDDDTRVGLILFPVMTLMGRAEPRLPLPRHESPLRTACTSTDVGGRGHRRAGGSAAG